LIKNVACILVLFVLLCFSLYVGFVFNRAFLLLCYVRATVSVLCDFFVLRFANYVMTTTTMMIIQLNFMCACARRAVGGLPAEKLVEAHGSFRTASCVDCRTRQSPSAVKVFALNHCISCRYYS
jgi:hypothetical protein